MRLSNVCPKSRPSVAKNHEIVVIYMVGNPKHLFVYLRRVGFFNEVMVTHILLRNDVVADGLTEHKTISSALNLNVLARHSFTDALNREELLPVLSGYERVKAQVRGSNPVQ